MKMLFESGASGTAPTPPSPGSAGYPTDGDLASSTPPTIPGAYAFYQLFAELLNVISAAGITPNAGNLTQLKAALDALYAPSGVGASAYWCYCNAAAQSSSGDINFQSSAVGAVGVTSYSSGVVTVTQSGIYRLSATASVGYNGGISGATGTIEIYRNGSALAVPAIAYWQEQNNTVEWGGLAVDAVLSLNAGDTVSVHFASVSGSSVKSSYGSFTGMKIA